MPEYIYRREDGSTFTVRQKFTDAVLTEDPATGLKVVRVMQLASIVFKGSGFYVNDSRNASKRSLSGHGSSHESGNGSNDNGASNGSNGNGTAGNGNGAKKHAVKESPPSS